MNIIGAVLAQGAQIAAAATTYYTSDNCRTRIDKATLTNPTAVNRLVTIYKIVSGGAAGDATTISYQKTVLAGQTVDVFELEGHWLENGDFIQALCDSANKVTLMMSGIKTPK
jgi:hypothetical protein